ncbi:arginine repressor [Coprobacter sp.]
MKNKVDRLQAIKEIIISSRISSQEDLLKHLTERGFDLTQATLSRDLKQLQIAKVAGKDGGYLYVMPETAGIGRLVNAKAFPHYASISGFLSIEFSGQLAVIKTRPGYASGIASDIDAHSAEEILGTIAGDDTILLILREEITRSQILETLKTIIPSIDGE